MSTILLQPGIYPCESRARRGGQGPIRWIPYVRRIEPAAERDEVCWRSPENYSSPTAALRWAETKVRMFAFDMRKQLHLDFTR